MTTRRSESGISALELVTIILIIGIIAAIALPNIVTASRSYTLNIAATALEQQLNLTRQLAVRSNQPTSIEVLEKTTQVDTNRDGDFDTLDEAAFTFSQEASVTAKNPTDGRITFTSRGEIPLAAPVSSPTITLTYKGKSRVITISPRGGVEIGPET